PGETLNGHVWVTPDRQGDHLTVTIADDGIGLGDAQSPGNGLGTQIVRTLVSADLAGSIQWQAREGGGTVAVLDVPLRPDSDDCETRTAGGERLTDRRGLLWSVR